MVAGAEGEVEVVEEKEREGWREEGQEAEEGEVGVRC